MNLTVETDFSEVEELLENLIKKRSAVLFPNFNRLEYTKIALYHYLNNTFEPHYLYLADNGSTDGTREFLEGLEKNKGFQSHYPHIKFVFKYYDENHMYAKMINDFFKWSEGIEEIEFLGRILNDDLCPKGWLKEFIRLMDKSKEKGFNVGAIFTFDGKHIFDLMRKDEPERIIDLGDEDYLMKRGINGHGQLMRKDVIKTLREREDISNDGYVEERGVMAPAFYYGYMDKAGYLICNHSTMTTVLLDTHPILGLEKTNKYKRYAEMLDHHKMGRLECPPENMYEELNIVGEMTETKMKE